MREFKPDLSSVEPLLRFGLTARATETLLWLSQAQTELRYYPENIALQVRR